MNYRAVTKARGVLISQMLRKNLLLRRDVAVKAAAVTLMSTDIDVIARILPKLHEASGSIVELAVGIYLLSTIVREASFLVMIPAYVLLLVFGNGPVARSISLSNFYLLSIDGSII